MKQYILFLLTSIGMIATQGCKNKTALPAIEHTTSPNASAEMLHGRQKLDSLEHELNTSIQDTDKITLLTRLSYEYRVVAPETGIKYANEALTLAQALNWKKGIALSYGELGLNHKYISDYPRAIEYTLKALRINEETGNKKAMAINLNNLGIIYQDQGDYPRTLDYFSRSLQINESLKDEVNIAGDLCNLGIIYSNYKKDFAKALDYESRSLAIYEHLNNKEGIAYSLGNIGDIFHKQGNSAMALQYNFRALAIFRLLDDKNSIAINMGNIGETYLTMAKDSGNLPAAAKVANLKLSIEYLSECVRLCREIGDLQSLIEYSNNLALAYERTGNDKEALKAYRQYTVTKDSIYSTDNRLKISKLETQRELEVKDKQIQLNLLESAKRRNERIFLIVVTILLLIIIGIGLQKYTRQKRSNTRLTREKKRHLAHIEAQKTVLNQIAHTQSHDVNGQVTTILGLVDLFNFEDTTDPDNKVIIEGIATVSKKLDAIVKETIRKENKLNKN